VQLPLGYAERRAIPSLKKFSAGGVETTFIPNDESPDEKLAKKSLTEAPP